MTVLARVERLKRDARGAFFRLQGGSNQACNPSHFSGDTGEFASLQGQIGHLPGGGLSCLRGLVGSRGAQRGQLSEVTLEVPSGREFRPPRVWGLGLRVEGLGLGIWG